VVVWVGFSTALELNSLGSSNHEKKEGAAGRWRRKLTDVSGEVVR